MNYSIGLSISTGLSYLTSPEWTTTKKICTRYNYRKLQWTSLSGTRFWCYFEKAISRIYENLSVGYYVFVVMAQSNIAAKTLSWRTEWGSMQWVLLLLLNVDTFEPMSILSKTYQTSINIPPYFITYNINRAKQILSEDIQSLKELISIITNHIKYQFEIDYTFNIELKKLSYLGYTKRHLSDILQFRWDTDHQLSFDNFFTDLYLHSSYATFDGSQFLDEAQTESIFVSESVSDDDTTSDYEPSEMETKTD